MKKRKRRGRPVNGILVLDKQRGLTSNGALQEVKRLFGAEKAGHTGSLDPLATGVLPICFGEGTKFSQFLLDADKRYLATAILGVATDSGDADGQVLSEQSVPSYTDNEIDAVLARFRGEIEQIPSMFSALKYKGEPLYKLARKGINVEREPRKVTIRELSLLDRTENTLTLDIRCTKGTYIRTLAGDIGERLGCGAHIGDLRRLAAGPYLAENALTIDELSALKESGGMDGIDQQLLEVETAVDDWPSVCLPDNTAYYFCQGQPVQINKAPVNGWVRVFTGNENLHQKFIGVGEVIEDGRIAPRRLVAE